MYTLCGPAGRLKVATMVNLVFPIYSASVVSPICISFLNTLPKEVALNLIVGEKAERLWYTMPFKLAAGRPYLV
uniref:Sulfate_transp domain-containing protein n=1 Tax=Panagrellus redivivus TaxID=6233 RepID=A0A7E4UME0_PANRE